MPLRKKDGDYVLVGRNALIGVRNISVDVHRTDEGVVVDLFRKGEENSEPIASTYAYFNE